MNNYLLISMKATHEITHKERKKYLDSFYGSLENKKKGMIHKFNNAHMFKNVVDDWHTANPTIYPAKVKSPDNYIAPQMLFFKHMWVDLSPNGIVKFVVPMGFEKHFIDDYSYEHKDICEKFVRFLGKVYPDTNIEMTYLENFEYSAKDFVLNNFYQSLDFEEDLYTVECSSHRLLTEEEIQEIYEILNACLRYGWKISQYYCEVCKEYHPDAPYHIEIEYEH